MKNFNEFLASKGITPEQLTEKDANEQAKLYNEFNEGQRKTIQEAIDSKASKEELEALKTSHINNLEFQLNNINKAVEVHGIFLKRLQDGQESKVTNKSFGEQVLERLNEKKAELETLSKGGKGSASFEIKAAGPMSLATNVTGQVPQAFRIDGMNPIASREVKFLSLLTQGTISQSNLIEWVYQANKDGTTNVTAEGAAKNQIDFDLLVGSQKVEKITAYIKVTTEMLNDISWMQSEINNELTREMMKKVEQQVYSGTGVSPQLNGVRTVATAFTGGSAALSVDNANEFDVLCAAVLQIEEANQPEPNAHFVHPSTAYKIEHLKALSTATDKRYVDYYTYITHDNNGQMFIKGIPVIKSTLVTAGEFLTGYFPMANFYTKENMSITVGLDSDDFTKNFRTVLAEWRGVSFVKHNDRTAFVKGDFTTAKAALETA